MSRGQLRSFLQKLGSTSPIVLGAVYTFATSVVTVIGGLIPKNAVDSVLVAILAVMVLVLLFVTVTWFREDDWLAAGVLVTLIIYTTVMVRVLLLVVLREGIGPAALLSAVTVAGAIVYAILLAPIVGGLVALARKLTRDSLRTVA